MPHEEGLVHRDIKPGNLMLSHKGDKALVKVLDFGLAKVTREERVDGGLTSEGQALGTPDFIAPEQIVDAPSADIRADIYSLGATLYYLLTGHPPFQANSLYDMYQAHMSRNADPLNLVRPEVPAELAALVAKMMAKDPARRFQTPGEVAEALMPFFKKGNAAFKSPKPEVSRAGQTNVARPATASGGPVVRAQSASGPAVREPRWESLIEIPGPKPANEPEPAAAAKRRPPRSWRPVALAVVPLGLLLLGIVIMIRGCGDTKEISFTSEPDDKTRPVVHSIPTPPKSVDGKEKVTQQVDKTSPVVPSTPASPKSLVNSIGMTLKLDPGRRVRHGHVARRNGGDPPDPGRRSASNAALSSRDTTCGLPGRSISGRPR